MRFTDELQEGINHQRLLQELLALCEKQYRKGFLQGVYAIEEKRVHPLDIDDWKCKGAVQNYCISEDPHTGSIWNQKERIEWELVGWKELEKLFHQQG